MTNNNKQNGLRKTSLPTSHTANNNSSRYPLTTIHYPLFLFVLCSLFFALLSCVLGEDIDTLRKRAEGEKKLPVVTYTVSFEADGGLPAPDAQTVKAGEKAGEPGAMAKEGFFFGGWFRDEAFEMRWDFDADLVDGDIVLHARWVEDSLDSYLISFTANGGIPVPVDQIIETGGKVAEPEKMTKEGHAFGGWFLDGDFENQWDFDADTASESMTLHAKWVMLPPDTHLVIFIANGGRQVPDDAIAEDGSILDRPDNPLREGFTFGGWYREAGFLNPWDFAADAVAKNEILYGKWETLPPGHYAVRFVRNGGSPFLEDIAAPGGEKLNEPAVTKDSSTFGGWFKNSACTEPWLFNYAAVAGSLTLYAKWNPPGYYTVNFIANNGTPFAQQLAALGSTVNQGEIMQEGYAFGGWYEDPGLVSEWDIASYKVTGNLNLFTKLTPINYAVVYDKNSAAAEGVMENSSHAYDASKALIACVFTRTGYAFAGWSRAAGGAAEFADCAEALNLAAIEGAAVTLYAKWLPVSYAVKYDKNAADAEGQMADSLHVYDAEKTLSKNVFTRQIEYTTFGGWNSKADGTGTVYTDEQIVVNLSTVEGATVTLYAQWFSIADWLAAQPGGASVSDPVHLSLGSQLTETAWLFILGEIAAAGKYVDLDLSACTRSGSSNGGGLRSNGTFDPLRDILTGKDRIVSIALPDAAANLLNGGGNASSASSFRYFTNLITFSGRGLISIGSYVFSFCQSLALTELPQGITSIGVGAFYYSQNLALTDLPLGITSIGESAFASCTNLALTELPDGITFIGNRAFSNCTNLTSLILPASVSISGNPFSAASLSMFTLIGSGSLSTIENGKALIRNNTELIAYPSATGNITLPLGITSIGDFAFSGLNSRLTQLELPEEITSIGISAFQNNTRLTLITLPSGLTSIGEFAFYGCTSLVLSELPSGLTSIGRSAFRDCSSLALTELPPGLVFIGDTAFYGCTSLVLTELPEGLTSIGGSVFRHVNLPLTELPLGVTSIGSYAFQNNQNLNQITLPSGLSSIGSSAFRDCTNLALVSCLALVPPSLGSNVFMQTHASLQIKVPAGSVDAYKAAPGWSEHADRISAIE